MMSREVPAKAMILIIAGGAVPLGILAAHLVTAAPQAVAQGPAPRPELPATPDATDFVSAADAFLAVLSDQQRAVAQIELKAPLAAKWSNFPDPFGQRNGVFFRDLKPEQVAAALKVARLALSEEGFTRFQEVRAADDKGGGGGGPGEPGGPRGKAGIPKKKAEGRGGPAQKKAGGPPGGVRFGSTHFMIAFLGKPSKSTPWLLPLGGHHLAFNIYYKGTTGVATPYHVGVEPLSWKDVDGKTHAPLKPMRFAMHGMINSLTPEQLKRAKLESRFNDVYVGPGRDGQFPPREGMPVSELPDVSKDLVKKAIAAWTGDTLQSSEYRKLYDAEIEKTNVAYSGDPSLSNAGDYVRIDGPHVWIEFSCQRGIHYHTIWRDRATDYGAEFSF